MKVTRPIGARELASERPADPYRVYRTVGTVVAVLMLGLIALELARNAIHPSDRDFVSFWGAARLALSGTPALAYDNEALRALQAQHVTFRSNAEMPFPYPPAFLLLVLPFATLSFPAAMVCWSLTTLAAWLAVIRRMFPSSGWLALAFPPIYANAAIGQNGCATAALLAGGLLFLQRRPFVAGLILGCLVLKPQLALLLPIAMIAGRQWRAIIGAVTSAASLLIVGLLVFGTDASRAWLAQMPLYAEIARNGLVGWHKFVSVYAAARQVGLAAEPAFIIHCAIALCAAWAVWRVWRSDAEMLAKASVLIAATMLASPYLFFYDAVALTVPLLFLAERKMPVPLTAVLWFAPIASIAMLPGPINVGPFVPIALLWLLWRCFRRGDLRMPERPPTRDRLPAFG